MGKTVSRKIAVDISRYSSSTKSSICYCYISSSKEVLLWRLDYINSKNIHNNNAFSSSFNLSLAIAVRNVYTPLSFKGEIPEGLNYKVSEMARGTVRTLILEGINPPKKEVVSIIDEQYRLVMTPQRGVNVSPRDHKNAVVYALYRLIRLDDISVGERVISSNPFWGILDLLMHIKDCSGFSRAMDEALYGGDYFTLVNKGNKEDLLSAINIVETRFRYKDLAGEVGHANLYCNSPAAFMYWAMDLIDIARYEMMEGRDTEEYHSATYVLLTAMQDSRPQKQDVVWLLDSKVGPNKDNRVGKAWIGTGLYSLKQLRIVKKYAHNTNLAKTLGRDCFLSYGSSRADQMMETYWGHDPRAILPKKLLGIFTASAHYWASRYEGEDWITVKLEEVIFQEGKEEYWDEETPKDSRVINLSKQTLSSGNIVSLIPIGDSLHWSIGKLTDCCQQRGNQAHSVCAHSFCSDRSEVIVIRNQEDTILYMSWVWLNNDGDGLMLDSIEGSKKLRGDDLCEDWKETVDLLLKENQFIKEVRIGEANWGRTKNVRKGLGLENTKASCEWDLFPPTVYMDCGDHHVLAGSQEPTEAPVPFEHKDPDEGLKHDLFKEVYDKVHPLTLGAVPENTYEERQLLREYDWAFQSLQEESGQPGVNFQLLRDLIPQLGENPFGNNTDKVTWILDMVTKSLTRHQEIIDQEAFIELYTELYAIQHDKEEYDSSNEVYDYLVDLEYKLAGY